MTFEIEPVTRSGTRVDEMLPPELVARLIEKLTSPPRTVPRGRNRRHKNLPREMFGQVNNKREIQNESQY